MRNIRPIVRFKNVCVTSQNVIKNIKILRIVLLLHLSVCVKFEHNSLIGLEVIYFFVCIDFYVKSRFVLICKFDEEMALIELNQIFLYTH